MQKTQSEEAHGERCAREAAVISTLLVTQPFAVRLLWSHGSTGRALVLKPCGLIITLIAQETDTLGAQYLRHSLEFLLLPLGLMQN